MRTARLILALALVVSSTPLMAGSAPKSVATNWTVPPQAQVRAMKEEVFPTNEHWEVRHLQRQLVEGKWAYCGQARRSGRAEESAWKTFWAHSKTMLKPGEPSRANFVDNLADQSFQTACKGSKVAAAKP